MNFILTSSCNKGCPYCFASQDRRNLSKLDTNMDMSYDKYLELLRKIPEPRNNVIKLLGGEPTTHPEFNKFLDTALKMGFGVTLISNFLFEEKVLNHLKEVLKNHNLSFLINATNLDTMSDKKTQRFIKNYKAIYKFLYQINREESMSLGITFENDKDAYYYKNYIFFLRDKLKVVERLRMSLAFPGNTKDKDKFDFINNYEYGKKFIFSIKAAHDIGAIPNLDCIIFPCMFENKEEYKYVRKFLEKPRSICNSAPTDIFKDDTISYCYPLRDQTKVDINKYENLFEARDACTIKYNILKSIIKLPHTCQSCSFMKNNMCEGPCLGFFNLTKELSDK